MAKYYTTPQQLLERIESLRKQMVVVATVKGFTSEESLAISQELDFLLNTYETSRQKLKK